MDKAAIQSSLSNPRLLCLIHSLEDTQATDKADKMLQMAMIMGYCEVASTSGVALSTQTMVLYFPLGEPSEREAVRCLSVC